MKRTFAYSADTYEEATLLAIEAESRFGSLAAATGALLEEIFEPLVWKAHRHDLRQS